MKRLDEIKKLEQELVDICTLVADDLKRLDIVSDTCSSNSQFGEAKLEIENYPTIDTDFVMLTAFYHIPDTENHYVVQITGMLNPVLRGLKHIKLLSIDDKKEETVLTKGDFVNGNASSRILDSIKADHYLTRIKSDIKYDPRYA